MLFIASLSLHGLSASTARIYVASIGFQCKILGYEDVTKQFVISKMLEGIKRSKTRSDCRLPITPSLLSNILLKLPAVCTNVYETILFSAAYSLAFFGFLRVGELTASKRQNLSSTLCVNDINLIQESKTLIVSLRFSKTDQEGKGERLQISAQGGHICPVKNVKEFLSMRPKMQGPFFVHFDGSPLTRYQFSAVLSKALAVQSLSHMCFKSHSFRIGAATTAASLGMTDKEIKLAGRWSSDAYKGYVRSPTRMIPKLIR
ncbi:uncharacterized protein LOC128556304 [Mercenaria mercenaria]|uniref:uncharacterized protein LOC128556304 n=1 Tax=Mercenaria mercenaria TaxID=6596 RepID=UPI00234F782D|nr:uncharacterized protein LOC128556304 [Mercenaria mercenaria]